MFFPTTPVKCPTGGTFILPTQH